MCPHVCDAPQAPEQLSFQTIGGTDVRVGRTTLGDPGAPGPHVSLRVGHAPTEVIGICDFKNAEYPLSRGTKAGAFGG